MKRQRRVLIVEDEQKWIDELVSAFKLCSSQSDYRVLTAKTINEATALLKADFYHFLSLDISMVINDPDNAEGMDWLKELYEQGQTEAVAVVILSAYGTKRGMRTAFSRYRIADFLDKDDYDDEEFLEIVEDVFDKYVRINLDLEIYWQQGRKPEQAVANLEFDDKRVRRDSELQKRLAAELDDLLCRLFHNADSLLVEALDSGHSKGAVLKVQPSFGASGVGHTWVVKYGESSLIDREYHNFKLYVENFVGGSRSTNVMALRRTQMLGGIVYSFLGATGDRFESFGEFYARANAAQIKTVLGNLFQVTCGRWYSNLGKVHHHNLTEDYQKMLGFDFEKLEKNREDLKSVQGRERLLFEDLTRGRKFTNPIQAARNQEVVKPTYVVTTHGDFNQNNILLDQAGNTWLIDFGMTGPGHILRDVAKLDSVVRFQLLTESEATLEERLAMEELLCGLIRFSDVDELPKRFAGNNPAVAKAFEVSTYLISCARRLLAQNTHEDISEYHAALLFNALNTIRFYSLPNLQRQHALLTASLLCDRIGLRA